MIGTGPDRLSRSDKLSGFFILKIKSIATYKTDGLIDGKN
jgi:hypothetical protein